MLRFSEKIIQFVDIKGNLREINLLSVLERYTFRERLIKLFEYVDKLEGNTTASFLLGSDAIFIQHIQKILSLFNLELNDLPVAAVVEFLFEHEDSNGVHHAQGILVEMNFPVSDLVKEEKEADAVEIYNREKEMTDTLSTLFMLETSLKDVLEVADSFSPEMLANIIRTRADYEKLANRDPIEKSMDKSKKYLEKLQEREAEANQDNTAFLEALQQEATMD